MTATLFPFGIHESMSVILILVGIFALFALLLIPSLLAEDGKPLMTAQAIYCYLMKSFGIVLGGLALFTLLLHLLAGTIFPIEAHLAPLFVFVVGVWIVLYFSKLSAMLDSASSLVPKIVFLFGFQLLGVLLLTFSGLSIGIEFLQFGHVENVEVSASVLLIAFVMLLIFSRMTTKELHAKHGLFALLKPKRRK